MNKINQNIKRPEFTLSFLDKKLVIEEPMRGFEFELSDNLFFLLDGRIARLIPVDVMDDDCVQIGQKLRKFFSPKAFNSMSLPAKLHLPAEVGRALSLLFALCQGVKDLDRVELIARRLERFRREEIGLWHSWTTRFHKDVSDFAIRGFRTVLCGEGKKSDEKKVNSILSGYKY